MPVHVGAGTRPPVRRQGTEAEDLANRVEFEGTPGVAGAVGMSTIAGWIAIFAATALSGAFLGSMLLPWRAAASVLIGRGGVEGTAAAPAFLVGLVAHFALAILFGCIYRYGTRRLLAREGRISLARHAALGMLFGLALYLVNFQVIARILYPWMLDFHQLGVAFLHVVAFGLPVGMMTSSLERRSSLAGPNQRLA